MELHLTVNGDPHTLDASPAETLLGVLRDRLGLTGTKEGCSEGECGACTVLVDGAAVRSCLVFAVQADGGEVVTVEGLAQGGALSPLQRAFRAHHALQCGFCTPGFLVAATALLAENPDPTADEVRAALSGQICRCTGYVGIVEAVLAAAKAERA